MLHCARFLSVAFLLSSPAVMAERHPAEIPVSEMPPLRSADYRQDQRIQLTFSLGGIMPYLGFAVNFAYFQQPNSLLTFSYLSGTRSADVFNFLWGHEENTRVQLLSGGYKQFFGNSFYLEGTGFVRRLRQSSYHYKSYSYREEEAEFRVDSLGGTFAIGNQWQWPTFTIGCDWIGVEVPLAHGAFKEDVKDIINEAYVADEQSDFKAKAKDSQPILARFYLGYSF
jgi:hypothetical protein